MKKNMHIFQVILDLSPSRLRHAVCPGHSVNSLLHSPQPLPGQCHLHHVLCPSRQVLGERLQVGGKKYFKYYSMLKSNAVYVNMLLKCVVLKFFFCSTKRVDHSNTRLASQLDRNPGEDMIFKLIFPFKFVWQHTTVPRTVTLL